MFVFQAKDLQEINVYAKPIIVIENTPYSNGMTKVTLVDRSKIPAGKQDEFDNQLKNYENMPKGNEATVAQKNNAREAYSELRNAAGGAQFEVVVNTTKQGQLTENKKEYVFNFSVGSKMSKAEYRKLENLTLADGKPLVRDLDQPTYAEQKAIDKTQQYVAIDIGKHTAYMVDAKTAEVVNKKHEIPAAVTKASGGYPMKGDARSFNPNVAVAYPLTAEGVNMVKKVGYDLPPQLLSIANIQSKPTEVKAPKKPVIVQ